MKQWTSIIILVVAFLAAAQAQRGFIKFDGIDGESTDNAHPGWCDLKTFSQGMSNPAVSGTAGAPRRRGTVTMEDMTCTRVIDKASPKLAESCARGTVIPKAEIHITRTTSDGARVVYVTYELKDVRVTSYRVGNAAENEAPQEELSLNFSEIKLIYTEFDERGRKKGNIEYHWKVEEGK